MESIQNTQTLTRFLRSKDESLDDILMVIKKLLDNEFDFSFSNYNLFLLELLCDRINDNNKFKNWKFSTQVWKSFSQVWKKMMDIMARDRTFRRVKFLVNLEKIFSQFYEINDTQFYEQLLEVTEMIYSQVVLYADESSCISFLESFLNIYQTDLDDDLLVRWTTLAKKLFKIYRNDINYVASKKSTQKFFHGCLSKLLNNIQNLDDSLNQCRAILISIVEERVFSGDYTVTFQVHFKELLKGKLPESSVGLFYKIIVKNIGNKNPKFCEEVYLAIMEKYNSMSESLIEILSSSNKPLTTSFFESVLDKTLSIGPINWKLVGYIINLDSTLAMDRANNIIDILNVEEDKIVLGFVPTLISSYVKARDLYEFLTQAWLRNVRKRPCWSSTAVIDAVSDNINDLSSTQLVKVIEYVSENDFECYPIVLALVKGLPNCSTLKVDSCEEVLSKSKYVESRTWWDLKFYLLVNYPKMSEYFIDRFNKEDISLNDTHYYLFVFRLSELSGVNLMDEHFSKSFLKHLEHEEQGFCKTLLQRWCVLMNKFFDSKDLQSFINFCIQKLDKTFWVEFLKSNGDIFFEQKNMVLELINVILNSNSIEVFSILSLIPFQCIDRQTRAKLIDKLTDAQFFEPIQNLLTVPTFKSSIETDLNCSIKVLAQGSQVSKDIFSIIWLNNLRQAKSDNKFTSKALSSLKKHIKKRTKEITPEFEATGLVIKYTNVSLLPQEEQESFSELKSKYMNILMSISTKKINSKASTNTIKELLSFLDDVLDSASALISPQFIKMVGKEVNHLNDHQVNSLLFKIATRVWDISNYKHTLSLFLILYKHDDPSLKESLEFYLSRVSDHDDIFSDLILFVLTSMSNSLTSNNSHVFINLCNSMSNNFKKNKRCELSLGVIISLVINKLPILTEASLTPIKKFLSNIRTALTDISWCFTQYSIEQVITIVTKVTYGLNNSNFSQQDVQETYILATQVMAHIILYHRFRLTSRHHMIISVFVALLSPLTLKGGPLKVFPEGSSAFARLLSNLCEPSSNSRNAINKQLTTATSIIKKHLRNFLPVLLVNYISFSLTQNFSRENNNELLPGVFNIFDVLSQRELEIVNSWLDSQGVALYKSLYNDYKAFGKWKEA
ncbi:hypothetical protein PSN45_003318 [Yamadazyma tenuis]|uniref:Nucleolar 27S pre-rRNA processing Urb2/Npa2 C-terminal domain-containing protein n=1 Tax=Candida tenuis (strain ATCC 10573 / BCRC 21748 / CBS 615 / JCM 9827 / NBRC 10315 / NRRL Y-1498 / VKM Y-70) TaxID=590646 RepID=G3AYL3_CANTC|nr:uncharacterized protein CANTEDRAFT_92220 [Yamadazyma tenuis ATCC 10573]EGV65880.1 hypothetical protein CANTEDRAFT_92220 [Yamadazyma tenuis ATCC 10573]WEJ95791.1 hypothetical protein PSN45_003318 [Yamadazyma tenuis]